MSDLSQRIANLSPEKRALFERCTKKGSAIVKEPEIARRDASDPCAVSFAQQRLWFLDQFEPGSPVYNIPAAVRLTGLINVTALEQSLNEIVQRHEALRTSFSALQGEPMQMITPTLCLTLPITDLQELPAAEREAEARRLATQEARRPFDLAQGPLLRAVLLRLGEKDHALLLTMHHIVSDGWSMGVLFRELSVLYGAFSTGRPSALPELAIQYADFAVWQRQWLQGEVLEEQLEYWKKQLDAAPPLLELPIDRPRPAVQTFQGASRSMMLGKTLSEALGAFSRQEGVTLYMTLLTAFQTLLYRYTGQDDIVVGSPIAGRNRVEIEELIGFFVNTLVLRTDLSGNPTFRQLLGRVREVCLGAYAHQDLPFEKLVEELQPERNLSYSPLVQVYFNMVTVEASRLELWGLKTEPVNFSEPDSKFDLTLYVKERKSDIQLELVYNANLFNQVRMLEMLNQFKHLLLQVVKKPDKSIASYSLVTEASQHLLPDPCIALTEPHQKLVMNMFACWVERTPEKEAVSQGEHSWTYAELAECAAMLAHDLIARGVEKGDVVALYGSRSFGLIAGMLGVLLSDGVMLPLDHSLPNQRKRQMLREASAKCLVYVGARRPEDVWFDKNSDIDLLCVDADTARAIEDGRRANLKMTCLPEVSPDDPAYIFFTSGTTGVPNGVLGCHKSLSHFLNWQGETFDIGSQDRVAQLTTLSFDVVLRDIFMPLTHGATLCLPEEKDSLEPQDILIWLEQEQISILHVVPTLAQSWLDDIPGGVLLPSLRQVFFAGEPLTDSMVRRWQDAFPSGAIINLYGPTETTMAKCFYRVPSDVFPGIQPLGQALPQTQAMVIANKEKLCGIGERGEIVIRTPFRSLGYINSSEVSQTRFVKNPFRDDDNDMLYYTGDLGRYRPDGTLEILGRCDDQVKIRGVRVEPDEVTATLSRHSAVKACIVIANKGEQGQAYLVSYVVSSGQGSVEIPELMSYLSQQLPSAIVPTRFIFLDALPMTPNGKVNRKALPVSGLTRPDLKRGFVPPRTPVEDILAAIWSKVLNLEKVGIYDNFFELGGHSLLATQVISRVINTFRVKVPLRSLFQAPTVADMAVVIVRSQVEKAASKDIDHMLAELEALSDGEARRSFTDERVKGGTTDERS